MIPFCLRVPVPPSLFCPYTYSTGPLVVLDDSKTFFSVNQSVAPSLDHGSLFLLQNTDSWRTGA